LNKIEQKIKNMKIEYKTVDEKRGIVQITCPDSRFYGSPDIGWFPSVTFICSYYPKGKGFEKWLADKGMDKAEEIKVLAGEKGSAVHNAIDRIIKGDTLKCDEVILDNQTMKDREYTAEEWEAIASFIRWWKTLEKPKLIANEFVILDTVVGYGGTVDILMKINGQIWLIDIKTSKAIHTSHMIQVSAYKQTLAREGLRDQEGHVLLEAGADIKLGIIQVGYQMNRDKFKFTEVEDKFDLFLSTKAIWEEENGKIQPKQYELPMTLSL
jgi:hypothetical protein